MAKFLRYRGMRINIGAIGSYKEVNIALNDGSNLPSTVLNLTEVYESRRLKNKTTMRNYSYRIFAIGVTPNIVDDAIENNGAAVIDITPKNIDDYINMMKKKPAEAAEAEQDADDHPEDDEIDDQLKQLEIDGNVE